MEEHSKKDYIPKDRPLNVYEQRFLKLMMLIRIDRTLKKMKVTHKK
jgi:hypothetical protein